MRGALKKTPGMREGAENPRSPPLSLGFSHLSREGLWKNLQK